MGIMDVCVACHQPIVDKEQWFRVREDYVHLACSEKYLRLTLERRQEARRLAPNGFAPETAR